MLRDFHIQIWYENCSPPRARLAAPLTPSHRCRATDSENLLLQVTPRKALCRLEGGPGNHLAVTQSPRVPQIRRRLSKLRRHAKWRTFCARRITRGSHSSHRGKAVLGYSISFPVAL